MLYHLLVPMAESISALNVFRYLTFRSIGAALTALMITFVMAPLLIRLLRDRQVGQTVREDTPDRHQQKTGTPTMGGTLILFALLTSTLLWSEWTNQYVWSVLGVTLGCGAIAKILASRIQKLGRTALDVGFVFDALLGNPARTERAVLKETKWPK